MKAYWQNSRTVWFISISLCVLLVAGVAVLAWREYRATALEFQSWSPEPELQHLADLPLPAATQQISFRTEAGNQIAAWYVPPIKPAVVIVAHGTNSDRLSMLPELQLLAQAGFGVLAFDWPGHGQSTGTIDWDRSEQLALRAALAWVRNANNDSVRIGGLGFSFGGIIMAQVAADDARLAAVTLVATPTSFDEYEHLHHSKWPWLSEWSAQWAIHQSGVPNKTLTPYAAVARIAPRPVLFVGGDQDSVVPPAMLQRLYDAAQMPKRKVMIEGARHGGYWQAAPDTYRDALVRFFTDGLLLPTSTTTSQ